MAMQMFSFGASFEIEKKILPSSVCLLLLILLFAFSGYQRQGHRYTIQINVKIKLYLMQLTFQSIRTQGETVFFP